MPMYVYACPSCTQQVEEFHPIGEAPGAIACGLCASVAPLRIGYGVNISATALETKGVEVRAVDEREDRWHADMPAYKRMRKQGMQPTQIDGAAAIENKVGDQFDINYHHLYDQGVTRERVKEGAEQAEQIMAEGVPL